MNEELLNKVEKKTKVKKDLLVSLATKLSQGNMKDEASLSEVIDELSKATGKNVSDDLKNKIIKTIKDDKVPDNVEKMF